MGFFKKIIRKVTKPVSKVLDKIIPNEVKPFLPYISAAVPFLAPTTGILGTMAGRAALSGGSNILAQLAQEGSEGDFSGLSALLATATGALSAPGTATYGPAGPPGSEQIIQSGSPGAADFFAQKAAGMDTGILKSGTEFLGKTAEGLASMGDILRPGGEAAGLNLATAKAAMVPLSQGTTDLAMATARRALKDYEDELDAFNLQAGQAQEASDSARRAAIISSMTAAAFDQGIIDDTLAQLGLKDGGRVGLRDGGDPDFGGIPAAVKAVEEKPKEFLVDKLKVTVQPGQSEQMAIMNAMMNDVDGVMPEDRKMEFYKLYLPQLRASGEISEKQYEGLMGELFGEGKADGGLMGLRMGGMPMEMDYRQGGFIPVGSKERADDVPARLSKNEFVMTADAVRAAGGGSVNKGAQRMYELMNNLEARV
jgi:hypothetical protein